MTNVSWGRLVLAGLIASVIVFMTDGFLHDKLLEQEWQAVYAGLGATEPGDHGLSMLYFAVFELGRGLMTLFLYAMMRARFGPGPKTALFAGVAAWFAFSLTGPAQFIPLGFFSNALWMMAAVYQLVTSVLAAVAGAAAYKETV